MTRLERLQPTHVGHTRHVALLPPRPRVTARGCSADSSTDLCTGDVSLLNKVAAGHIVDAILEAAGVGRPAGVAGDHAGLAHRQGPLALLQALEEADVGDPEHARLLAPGPGPAGGVLPALGAAGLGAEDAVHGHQAHPRPEVRVLLYGHAIGQLILPLQGHLVPRPPFRRVLPCHWTGPGSHGDRRQQRGCQECSSNQRPCSVRTARPAWLRWQS